MKKSKADSDNKLALIAEPGEEPSRTVARHLLDPSTTAAGTLNRIHRGISPDSELNGYVAELQAQAKLASDGNLARSESMLTAQAATLDGIFHKLIWWALNNTGENGSPAYFETCMRLALKAQSQSRATNETLAAIKNPPVVYARQANFAAGHQQVNNGGEPSRVREIESPQTKLLEAQHGERLDAGATTPAIGANQAVEAVGALNRTAHGRGSGKGCAQWLPRRHASHPPPTGEAVAGKLGFVSDKGRHAVAGCRKTAARPASITELPGEFEACVGCQWQQLLDNSSTGR
jgi:hypothetical protein